MLETRRRALRRIGGHSAADCGEVARQAGVVICSLPSSEALRQAADELAAAGRPTLIVIETSTLPLAVKEAARHTLAAGGATLLDCPLSGTGSQARAKDLVVLRERRPPRVSQGGAGAGRIRAGALFTSGISAPGRR